MKKILALILSVLMLATAFCAVIPASAAADIGTLVNRHDFYVGEAKEEGTNDITDGVISDGEYSFSWELSNNTVLTGNYLNNVADGATNADADTDTIKLYMAHDEENVYIAIKANDVDATKKYPFAVSITRPNATTYGEMMDRINLFANTATAGHFPEGTNQVGTWSYTQNLQVNDNGTIASRTMPGTVTSPSAYDAYVTFDAENSNRILEFKITKQAIMDCFGIDTVDQIGLAVAHNLDDGEDNGVHKFAYYFSDVIYYDVKETLISEYELDSSVKPSWVPYAMNLSAGTNVAPERLPEPAPKPVRTLAEIVNFRNYYVGGQTATAPAIDDGAISAGEYTFAQTLATSDVATQGYIRTATDTVTGRAATDNIKLYMASDADYIYIAMESRQIIGNDAMNKNFFTVSLSRPNPTTYAEMMQRVHFRMTVTPAVGGDPVKCGFSYNSVTNVAAAGTTSMVSWKTAPVEAYAALTSDYTGITEMKISKAALATELGCDASVFDDGVGLGLQHMLYNYKASGVPFDSTLPYSEVACSYLQVLTADQKAEITDTFGLDSVNNWAPLMMNFSNATVNTLNSASVRFSDADGRTGLRFKTVFDKAYVEALTANATEWSVGTIILPADTLKGTAVTHEALNAAEIKYLDVPATYADPFASDANTVTIAGSIVGIKEANLDRDFTAIGYICVDGTYYYAASAAAPRNVKTIATIALGDLKAVETAEYANLVSEGIYSPYTEAQRVILSKLNGTYEEVAE